MLILPYFLRPPHSLTTRLSQSDTGMCLFVRRVCNIIRNNAFINIKAQRLVWIPFCPHHRLHCPSPMLCWQPNRCGLKSFNVTLIRVCFSCYALSNLVIYQTSKTPHQAPTSFWLSVLLCCFEPTLISVSGLPVELCLFIYPIFQYRARPHSTSY